MRFDEAERIIEKMEPTIAKGLLELADEAERVVPVSGKFPPVYFSFEDETKRLDIVYWAVRVRDLIYERAKDNEVLLRKRFIEVVGYFSSYYCGTVIVGSGMLDECVKLLRSPQLTSKVMKAMMNIIENSDT